MDYSMSGWFDLYGEVSAERTQRPFPFLKLPAEIRNMIYRLLLLTQNVTTSKPTTSEIFASPFELPDGVTSVASRTMAVGTVRSKCWRTYKMEYQIAILLTNRQIHREARDIFQLENFFTIVWVNKAGFAKEMKDRNFPIAVIPTDCPWRHVKFPVMHMDVIFKGGLADEKQTDVLVVATAHLKQLVQALWTAGGAAEMCVMIYFQGPHIETSPSEDHLLRPFFKLRSIKRLIINGGFKYECVDELTRAVTTQNGFSRVFDELTASIKDLQKHIKAEQWELAIAQEEKHSTLMIDCQIVYGDCHVVRRATKEIYIATAICIAEIALYRGDYTRTIRFADYGLQPLFRIFRILRLQNGNPVPVHSTTGIIPSAHESRYDLLVIRARASMGMLQAENSFNDIQMARETNPSSVALDSLSEDWYAMFASSTCSHPHPNLTLAYRSHHYFRERYRRQGY